MAVPIEFANLILHKSRLETVAPGVLDRMSAASPPNWAEDAHIVRVGFMSTGEAEALLGSFVPMDRAEGLAAIIGLGLGDPPGWIVTGAVDDHPAAWLAGHAPGSLVQPIGSTILFSIRHGTSWSEVEGTLQRSAVLCLHRTADTRSFRRDEALCDISLIRRDDGDVILMLSQSTARRRLFAEDSRLLNDVVTIVRHHLDGRAWPEADP